MLIVIYFSITRFADRNNDYSDEDEEGDFSSGDDNEDGTAAAMMRNFSNKAGNFRKLDRMNDNDPEDVVMLGQGAQCDSDSDFDPKDKNARTKISRVGLHRWMMKVWIEHWKNNNWKYLKSGSMGLN